MEAIRISCAGYPTRKLFDEFVDRFSILAPEVLVGRYYIFVPWLLYAFAKLSSDCYSYLMLVPMKSQLARGF